MTTKTEMTLENVCFKHDLREASEKAIEVGNKKYGANHKGEFECFYWVDKGKFFGHYDNFKRRKLIAPSDYLLLLSAPESQAHLLTEKEEYVNYGIALDPKKEYPVSYTINNDGKKIRNRTTLLAEDMTENQIKDYLHFENHFKLVSQPPVMKEKDKAYELMANYRYALSLPNAPLGDEKDRIAKQCALICVDEILGNIEATILYHKDSIALPFNKSFWLQVRTEIEVL